MNAFFYPSKRGINFAKIRGFKVTDYKKRPMQAGRWRNADSETPKQKRRCSNATLERYCTKAMRSVGFYVSHAAQEIK